ncbi:cAMP phosphodiesterases class-II-domain-containing protein [Lentinula detonsa]|uniref:cAMP phosphodiesterases class-II-domain-containing protein n=1 Tax=Lentinula detonsa TaxID=2804962 RepID=A0AA38USJ1_9AGAR|nr:cAMP phosphodiesterases class-II-domain-containing protein [Lentinula detonsa]
MDDTGPAFVLVCVGSGGGPLESNLSGYLLKPYNAGWEAGIVALEAGSGQGTLNRLLEQEPDLFRTQSSASRTYSASEIYTFVRCFLITHAHLDHVSSLVLSTGSSAGPRKRVYANKETLENLEGMYNWRIWPNLASYDENDEDFKLLYSPLTPNGKYHSVFPDTSVQIVPINHGTTDLGPYSSSAFFIRSDSHPSKREFLFFGDVEPDSITSSTPKIINVWRKAAPMIPNTLSTIFIECSWPSGRPDDMLHGHLTPEHLRDELIALATEVYHFRRSNSSSSSRPQRKRQKRNALSADELRGLLTGVRVYIIHCKDQSASVDGPSTRELIAGQVRSLVEAAELGAEILSADQGMYISECFRLFLFAFRTAHGRAFAAI